MVELVYIVLIATVAVGLGLKLLRRVGPICSSRAEELTFSLGLGLGGLALGVLLLGFAHLLYVEVFYVILALGAVWGRKELVGLVGRLQGRLATTRFAWRSFHFWLLVLITIGLALNLLRALMPAHGAVDPLAYHLALPKIYLLRHYLSFERTLTGALYPDNIGMLYLLAIALRGAILAQVVHWFMGATTVFAIWCFCRGYFNGKVGVWAAAIYAFTPVVVFFSPLAYVDVGVGLFQFLGIWALFKWVQSGDRRALLLTAIFCGLAMGAKHTSIFMAIFSVAIVVGRGWYRKEDLRSIAQSVLLFSAVSIGLVLPWYARALWEAGNPVWPVANRLFDGLPYGGSFSVSSAGGVTAFFSERALHLLYWSAASLWEWAWNGQLGWQRATGIYFVALLPGLLAYINRVRVRWLAFFCLLYYLLVVLYIDGNPRYSLALFAILSTLAGYVAEHLSNSRVRALGWLIKFAFMVTVIFNLAWGYFLSNKGLNFVFSHQTSGQFLAENEGNYQAFRYVDQHLPASSVVLLQGIVKGYYCERIYLWDHPHQMLLQYGDYKTSAELLVRMRELGITHIVRMINIPSSRTQGIGYPQYFADEYHEDFRKKYLKLLYRDRGYVVFEIAYPS